MSFAVLLQHGKRTVGVTAFETRSRTVQFVQQEMMLLNKKSYNPAIHGKQIKEEIAALSRGDRLVLECGKHTYTIIRALSGPAVKNPASRLNLNHVSTDVFMLI